MPAMPEDADLTLQRTRNPWGQGERLREEILVSAARLLSELDGEEALTIRGVARAVGIAPASIYQHFADKAELVRGVLQHDYRMLAAAMGGAAEAVPAEDVVGRVRAQMGAYCRFAVDNPGHYRLMMNHRRSQPEPAEGDRPLVLVVRRMQEAFERCAAAGYRLRQPADRAAITVFVGAHGRVALWHSDPDETEVDRILGFVNELISLVIADSRN
jgi:AcrR family transcriptional regulator